MDQLICCVKFNSDGHMVVGANNLSYRSWDGCVYYIKDVKDFPMDMNFLNNSSLSSSYSVASGVSDVCWNKNNDFLIGTDQGDVLLIRYQEKTKIYENLMKTREHDGIINCLDSDHKGNIAISASQDTFIKIWDLDTQVSIKTYKGHFDGVVSVSLNPNDNRRFLSCSQDYSALIWDQRNEKPASKLTFMSVGFPSSAAWSDLYPDLIALGSEHGFLCFYDTRKITEPIIKTELHSRIITKIVFKNSLIATASEDCSTFAIEISRDQSNISKIYNNTDHQDYIKDVAWLQNQESLDYITCSWDGMIRKHSLSH